MKDVGAFFYIENEEDEMKCEICGEKLYYSQEENGLCWSCQQKIETGKCKICDETLSVFELYGSGMCWWCEKDEIEPDPYDDPEW